MGLKRTVIHRFDFYGDSAPVKRRAEEPCPKRRRGEELSGQEWMVTWVDSRNTENPGTEPAFTCHSYRAALTLAVVLEDEDISEELIG